MAPCVVIGEQAAAFLQKAGQEDETSDSKIMEQSPAKTGALPQMKEK
jgi:hypothetical protein